MLSVATKSSSLRNYKTYSRSDGCYPTNVADILFQIKFSRSPCTCTECLRAIFESTFHRSPCSRMTTHSPAGHRYVYRCQIAQYLFVFWATTNGFTRQCDLRSSPSWIAWIAGLYSIRIQSTEGLLVLTPGWCHAAKALSDFTSASPGSNRVPALHGLRTHSSLLTSDTSIRCQHCKAVPVSLNCNLMKNSVQSNQYSL